MAEQIARDRAITEHLAETVMGWVLIRGNIWRTADGTKVIVGPTGWHPLGECEREAIADAFECLDAWRKANPGRGSSIQHHGYRGECTVTLTCPDSGSTAHTSIHDCRAICEALGEATEFKFEEARHG